jgi:hypothetical protein
VLKVLWGLSRPGHEIYEALAFAISFIFFLGVVASGRYQPEDRINHVSDLTRQGRLRSGPPSITRIKLRALLVYS